MRGFCGGMLVPVVACVAVTGCAVNPATGKRELMLVSEAQERALGARTDISVQEQFGLYPDDSLQSLVSETGERMASLSERPELEWTFRVVDDPLVNAFALPGGYIYMTRGILAHFNSEAEMASVLGHEIGHVTARHSARQLTKQQLVQAGLLVGAAVAPDYRDWLGLSQAGLGVLFLKFSRDDERQADDLGLRYLDRAGYDLRAMPEVFAMLDRVGKAGGADGVPGWLSTHPTPENREARIDREIAEAGQDLTGRRVARDEYLRRLEGVVYGDDPRQGFFIDDVFHQPEMELALDFPGGWRTANTRQAVAGISQAQDAIVRLTLADEPSATAALDKFLGQAGVTPRGSGTWNVHGLPARSSGFTAVVDQGTLQGEILFVEYRGNVFKVLGYTPADRWDTNGAAIEASLRSFRRLTDRRYLDVEPKRVALVEPDRSMNAAELAQRYDASVPAETLTVINGLDADGRFEAGRLYKVVQGGTLPDTPAR